MLLEKRKLEMFSIVINGGSYPSASSCAKLNMSDMQNRVLT